MQVVVVVTLHVPDGSSLSFVSLTITEGRPLQLYWLLVSLTDEPKQTPPAIATA